MVKLFKIQLKPCLYMSSKKKKEINDRLGWKLIALIKNICHLGEALVH